MSRPTVPTAPTATHPGSPDAAGAAPRAGATGTWLALDTATERCALALHAAGRTELWEGEGGAQASASVLPRAREMLDARGLGFRDLQAVAFGRGPGAFTGLRTACSVAQGLALAAGCGVVAVDSLMLVAEQARARWLEEGADPAAPLQVGVVMDARMGEVYAACYRWVDIGAPGGWAEVMPPSLCEPGALAEDLGLGPDCLAGSGVPMLGEEPAVPVRLALEGSSRAQALASLAQRLLRAGRTTPPEAALPLYLRDKVALTAAERQARPAAAAKR